MKTTAHSPLEDIAEELRQEYRDALKISMDANDNGLKPDPEEFINDLVTRAMWRVNSMRKRAIEAEELYGLEKNNVLLLQKQLDQIRNEHSSH